MPNIIVNNKNLGPIVLVDELPPLDGSIPFEDINKNCVYKVYENGKSKLYYYTNIGGVREWKKVGGGGIIDVEELPLPEDVEEECIYRLHEKTDVTIPTYTDHEYATIRMAGIYSMISITRTPLVDVGQTATNGFYVNMHNSEDGKTYSGKLNDGDAMLVWNNHLASFTGVFSTPNADSITCPVYITYGATKDQAGVDASVGYISAALADGQKYITAVCPGEQDPCDGYPRYNDDYSEMYTLFTFKSNKWYGLGNYELSKDDYELFTHAFNSMYVVDIDE